MVRWGRWGRGGGVQGEETQEGQNTILPSYPLERDAGDDQGTGETKETGEHREATFFVVVNDPVAGTDMFSYKTASCTFSHWGTWKGGQHRGELVSPSHLYTVQSGM